MIPIIAQSFLQSVEWEEFQRRVGRDAIRINGTLVIRHEIRGQFDYLYIPKLPAMHESNLRDLIDEIRVRMMRRWTLFLKIEPIAQADLLSGVGVLGRSVQPQQTTIVNLSLSDSVCIGNMHPKTRYNARLAQRKGVTITRMEHGDGAIDAFWEMLERTAVRDGFHPHSREYYDALLDSKSDEFQNVLYIATLDDIPLAAAIINFHRPSRVATYLHGASRHERRELMAPTLLHHRIIEIARRDGYAYYDFWGIDERRWHGLTRFKKGFGGNDVTHPSAVDMPYHQLLYRGYRFLRP